MKKENEKIEELTEENKTSEEKEATKPCCNHNDKDHGHNHHGNCHCDKKKQDKEKEELKSKIKELEELNKALTEKVKLAQAELVNYRRRKDEETANMLKYSNQDLILEILPILDNFERAISLDDNDLTDELSKFLAGFKMMYAA